MALVTRSSTISHWQVCTCFTQAMIEYLLLSETAFCTSAKLTLSHASILMCEKWYWNRELTSRYWKYWMTEKQARLFYLLWIYNKNNLGLKNEIEVTGISTHATSRIRGSTVVNFECTFTCLTSKDLYYTTTPVVQKCTWSHLK